jgi:head-tail adaptor
MAKSVAAGEMRTRITVQKQTASTDADGFPTKTWANVLTGGGMIRCKWVNAHGTEVTEKMRLDLGQIATITLRYTSLIDQRCRVFHEADAQTDANAWTVVSVNDPEDRHAFLEITLKRAVMA